MGDILAVAFEGHPIRVTPETPKRAAVFDVLAAFGYANPRDKWAELKNRHPEIVAQCLGLPSGFGDLRRFVRGEERAPSLAQIPSL